MSTSMSPPTVAIHARPQRGPRERRAGHDCTAPSLLTSDRAALMLTFPYFFEPRSSLHCCLIAPHLSMMFAFHSAATIRIAKPT